MAGKSIIHFHNDKSIRQTYAFMSSRVIGRHAQILWYGDLCVSIHITTVAELTSLITWINGDESGLPFKKIGEFNYIIENYYDLSGFTLEANVDFVKVESLYLMISDYDSREKCNKFKDSPTSMNEQDLYRELGLAIPQKQPPIKPTDIEQTLDEVKELPADVSSIVASYYNPYKKSFISHFLTVERQTQFIPPKPLKVVAIKYPKDANVIVSFHGLRILAELIKWDDGDGYIISSFGPCDRRLLGYNPEKKDMIYATFKPENEIFCESNKPCKVEFICIE